MLSPPTPQSDALKLVLASERYNHVSRLAAEMEAVIGQIETLSTGAPARDAQPQPETNPKEPDQ